jgi:putative membrane protein
MTTASSNRSFFVFNAVVSAAALAFLAWLLLLHGHVPGTTSDTLSFMPAVNASFNATAAVLLVVGRLAIRRGNRELHKRLMVSAFAVSGLFLIGYVAYHFVHGDTKYTGAYRSVYLPLLASHVLLSMAVLPLALAAFWFAVRQQFATHKKVTRVLWPIWLYVSVTGVTVFFFLHG